MNFKTFTHNPIVLPDIETTEIDGKRFYQTPGGIFPSVTTVLSVTDKGALERWKARVGEEEAERVRTRATIRGTHIHLMCEHYLNNQTDEVMKLTKMPAHLVTFKDLKMILDESVDNVRMQEAPLWSKFLKVAGRTDVIADFKGKLSIIDFKTSRKPKKRHYIKNYFMQASAYAVMFEELTGIPIPQIVIIIAVDGDDPQVFVEKRNDHIFDFIEVRKEYESKYKL